MATDRGEGGQVCQRVVSGLIGLAVAIPMIGIGLSVWLVGLVRLVARRD